MEERWITEIWQHLCDRRAVGGGVGDRQVAGIQRQDSAEGELTSGPNNCIWIYISNRHCRLNQLNHEDKKEIDAKKNMKINFYVVLYN